MSLTYELDLDNITQDVPASQKLSFYLNALKSQRTNKTDAHTYMYIHTYIHAYMQYIA